MLLTTHSLVALDGDCDDTREAEGWVVSSESCGFLSIGAQYVREVFPGEIIEMTRHGIRTIDIVDRPDSKTRRFAFLSMSTLQDQTVYLRDKWYMR